MTHSSPPPPSPTTRVTAAVERGYAAYTRRAQAWTARYQERGGRVYCGAGCFACCNMPIRVSLAEALVTAQALSEEEAARVETHARRVLRNARTAPNEGVYVERHRTEVGFCPLLDPASGGCTRYDVRPTRCRDTFSALPARYCEAGAWEAMTRREREQYQREVRRTPGTDGELHFIAPLEHLSEPIWAAAARAMRTEWGLEAWGDFWVLTTLARDAAFIDRVAQGDARGAWRVAKAAGLAHPTVLDIG
ncbi:YkgJ family cysteine cluster protein [Deinococcus sp. YIM 77859]|uniref:YkgJ family cysteine cluster protein n=1 Tax=Deinococcus sp. YIM 77859 TaxID=1540221 RepID=UPI00068A26B3|nr:YkgJ family cysteine cluster protein [Deinococcus sp. YIM 77859]